MNFNLIFIKPCYGVISTMRRNKVNIKLIFILHSRSLVLLVLKWKAPKHPPVPSSQINENEQYSNFEWLKKTKKREEIYEYYEITKLRDYEITKLRNYDITILRNSNLRIFVHHREWKIHYFWSRKISLLWRIFRYAWREIHIQMRQYALELLDYRDHESTVS